MLHRLRQLVIILTVLCVAVQSLGRGPMAIICLGCEGGPVSMTNDRFSLDACCSGHEDPESVDRRPPLSPCDCPDDCGCIDLVIGSDQAPSTPREQLATPVMWPTPLVDFASFQNQSSVRAVIKGQPRFSRPPADRSPGLPPAVSSTAVLLI